jgi:hypothetical protein
LTQEERLEKYGRCEECNAINTFQDWCISYNEVHFRKDFDKCTSGNKEMDYFIQNTQIHGWEDYLVLEWYLWENFSDIEEVGKGGHGTVFCAKTKVQRIKKWHHQKNDWNRFQKDNFCL